MANINVKNCPI